VSAQPAQLALVVVQRAHRALQVARAQLVLQAQLVYKELQVRVPQAQREMTAE
jgi:hypothetical protein